MFNELIVFTTLLNVREDNGGGYRLMKTCRLDLKFFIEIEFCDNSRRIRSFWNGL